MKLIEMKRMSKIEVPDIVIDMAYQQLLSLTKDIINLFMKALTDKFGSEEALKLIRPYFYEQGKMMANFAPLLGIKGNDAIAIATFIRFFEEKLMQIKGTVTEATPDRVVAVNTKCIFKDCIPEACLQFQNTVDGMIDVINPDYSWRMTKLLTRGEDVCEWIIEKKK